MTEQAVTRRLVAIFYADVVGYSRLTGVDEEGTHRGIVNLTGGGRAIARRVSVLAAAATAHASNKPARRCY